MTQTSIVYIVEDNAAARTSLVALIDALGFPTETFESAEQFLAQLQTDWRGCLISDVRLGGMSGIDLHRQIVDRNIALPVILITAYAEVALVDKANQRGAVKVLEKPCQASDLEAAIKAAMAADSVANEDRVSGSSTRAGDAR